MKNLIRSAALLMCSGVLFAQSQNAQTSVGQPTDTNEPVYKGCLTGTKNNYMLTTQDGKTYRLHSDKDIDDHINHNVEVRGSLKKEGADRSPSAANQFPEIDVADLKSTGKESCVGPAAEPKASNPSASGNVAMSTTDAGMSSQSASSTASTTDTAAAATTPAAPADSNSTASSTSGVASGSASASNASALPQSDKPQTSAQTSVGGATDKDEPLYKGCVSGKKDHYTLMTDAGDMYRLHSDKDINEHVGDRVEIRGTLKAEGDGHKVSADSKWKGEIDVADIKTVEDGVCKNK
jgi:hypothetical protein